jgi:hypothetical protein
MDQETEKEKAKKAMAQKLESLRAKRLERQAAQAATQATAQAAAQAANSQSLPFTGLNPVVVAHSAMINQPVSSVNSTIGNLQPMQNIVTGVPRSSIQARSDNAGDKTGSNHQVYSNGDGVTVVQGYDPPRQVQPRRYIQDSNQGFLSNSNNGNNRDLTNDGDIQLLSEVRTLLPRKTVTMTFFCCLRLEICLPVTEKRIKVKRDYIGYVFNFGTILTNGYDANDVNR